MLINSIIRAAALFLAAVLILPQAGDAWTHGQASAPSFPVTSGQNLLVRAQDIAQSDTSNVTTWTDTSGAGNNLTAPSTAPQLALTGWYDAKPYVYFDQGGDIGNASYSVNSRAFSFFTVIDYNVVGNTQYTVYIGSLDLIFMLNNGVWQVSGSGTTISFSQPTPPSSKRIGIVVTFGTGGVKLYLDSSSNVSSGAVRSAVTIPGLSLSSGALFLGAINEFRGFNRELSSGEVAQILDTWAPAVYGTGAAASAPAGRVIADGDSITLGVGATKSRNWPFYLNVGNGWFEHDYGRTGNTWANLISRQAVTNAFANSSNYLIVNAGTNDVASGRTAAQMETDFATYMSAAVGAGFAKAKIVVNTLSAQNLGAGGTARNDYNTWLRANYSASAGFLFDLQQDPDLGSDLSGVPNNPAYWIDGAHYNDAGYTLYASKIRAVIGSPPF